MTKEEIAMLDKEIVALEEKVAQATYDDLAGQLHTLLLKRYPERQEDAIKNRLYEAYRKSGKTLDFIIDFIEHADNEDDYWN